MPHPGGKAVGRARGHGRPDHAHRAVAVATGVDPDRARPSAAGGKGDLERAVVRQRAHRRQVDEAVRVQRPHEVDGLAAGPDERELHRRHGVALCRSRQARTFARFPQVSIEHQRPEWFFERS
jgi:hypothetical protein